MIHLPVNYILARDNENVGLFLSFEDPPSTSPTFNNQKFTHSIYNSNHIIGTILAVNPLP